MQPESVPELLERFGLVLGEPAPAEADQYAVAMAEALSVEQVPARLAEIRDQLKLLADYL